jgi:PKD repeat protein
MGLFPATSHDYGHIGDPETPGKNGDSQVISAAGPDHKSAGSFFTSGRSCMQHHQLTQGFHKGLVFILLLLSCFWTGRLDASVTIAWEKPVINQDGSPCTDLAGYKIYYDADQSGIPYNGTGLGQGSSPITVPVSALADPDNPEYVLSGLTPEITYHLAITAFDSSYNESGFSNEISATEATSPDTIAPTININSPTSSATYSTISNIINLAGTASDITGVERVTWANDEGASGTATGRNAWSISKIPLVAGANIITVTAHDAAGNTASDTLTATYSIAQSNKQPVANAGPDQVVSQARLGGESIEVILNGTASSDPDGDPLTYSWKQVQGGAINLMGSSTVNPFFSATSALSGQILGFQLVVSDGKLQSSPDIVLVTIEGLPSTTNTPPTARVSATPMQGTAPLSVSFTGSGTDADGSVIGYRWAFGDGSSSSMQNPSHTFSSPGDYTVTLTVTDNKEATATDRTQIIVSAPPAPNSPPTASFTATPTGGTAPQVVEFTANAGDSDGTIVSYDWDFGDNSTSRLTDPSHTYTTAGTYTVTLTVTDNEGAQGSTSKTISITSAASPSFYAQINFEPKSYQTPVGYEQDSGDAFNANRGYGWNKRVKVADRNVNADPRLNSYATIPNGDPAYWSYTLPNGDYLVTLVAGSSSWFGAHSVAIEGVTVMSEGSASRGKRVEIVDCPVTVNDEQLTISLEKSSILKNTQLFYVLVQQESTDAAAPADAPASDNISPSPDSDGDGITNQQEWDYSLNADSPDSDNDQIPDNIEWGPGSIPLDSDNDSTIDALDNDSDNDGKPDIQEGTGDLDGDGIPNYIDINEGDGQLGDQDGDGVKNSIEVAYMMNSNLADSDGDGIGDGTEFGPWLWPVDSDADGIIDALDSDSDNDGKPDSQEGTGDHDNDGALNYIDRIDSDGPEADPDGDGFSNLAETSVGLNPNLGDSDQDGLPDREEVGDIEAPSDTDGDGIMDALDADSDDDGVSDGEEGREDMDRNGIPDRLEANAATFQTKKGETITLKVLSDGSRLTETRYIPDAISTNQWKPHSSFRSGGLKFKAVNVPVGGTVDFQVLRNSDFSRRAGYWKYDPDKGYFRIDSSASGKVLSFSIKDGGEGDADYKADGIIVDPGFIDEPAEVPADPIPDPIPDSATPGIASGGGGGCKLARDPADNHADGLLILFPLIALLLLRHGRRFKMCR